MSALPPKPAPVVVVGVTGSIAAYKSADLVSRLVKRGCEVHVAMTHGAQQFVTPLTFQTLSRNSVITTVFDGQGWKPGHVDLADRANLLLVAPATANIIAELAHGLAANPITEIALVTLAPVLIAPAILLVARGVREPWLLASLAPLAFNWISTWRVQIPLHDRLANGFDAEVHRRVVAANWWRTAAWSIRAGCLLFGVS